MRKNFLAYIFVIICLFFILIPALADNSPVISDVKVNNITHNSVTISWKTNIQADSSVTYSTNINDLNNGNGQVRTDDSYVTEHAVNLNTLQPATHYAYKISSKASDGGLAGDVGDFTTSSASVQSSITLLSPKGGETWIAGKTYTIKWSSVGIPQDLHISLNLINRTAKNNIGSWITMSPQNTGEYNFVVPTNAEPGPSYEMLISVCSYINGQDICADGRNPYWNITDKSDSYFTIAAPSVILKSEFFKNDPTANNIVNSQPYDMREFKYYSIVQDLYSIDNFSYKVLSALRMIGYNTKVTNDVIAPNHFYAVEQLNKFQTINNLPLSEYLNKDALIKIDASVAQKEANYYLGRSFPLYNDFVSISATEVPKEHYLSIVAASLKALPANLVFWTKENFTDEQLMITYDKQKNVYCDPEYYKIFSKSSDLAGDKKCLLFSDDGSKIPGLNNNDWQSILTTLHEYGHYLDGFHANKPGVTYPSVDTKGFKDISWIDYNTKKRLTMESSYSTYEFINNYGASTAMEDFAEAFSYYVLNGRLFREAMKYNSYLNQKYSWLKENVFKGVEYDTGGYKAELSAGSDNFPSAFSTTNDANYIWNGKFSILPISEAKPNIKINNFKYYAINDRNGVDTQIEFDMINAGNSNAGFWLASWDDTTNYPLKTEQYHLTASQSVHVSLIDAHNINRLKVGNNNISLRIVSLDSRLVYGEQNFVVVRQSINNTTSISNNDTQISYIQDNAKLLVDDKYGQILAELKQLRNTIKEQQTEIKYLKSLVNDVKAISEKAQETINNFITYGVDANTAKLGAGERAAVMNSYKAAFDKLPETEAELADVIKIANGRFPSVVNDQAEAQAKEQFLKIYKRKPDMNGAKDAAAVKIMAYGLRQKAENRNLNSEKVGIKIFKAIYGHTPKTTTEWNAMQAITYSGATQKTWSGYNPQ
jgi:hypothetical protein